MLAVVLVGGFGTRLRPLTNDVPKPMLPVVHRPMIVRLVERLADAGVDEVVLALGFKPEPFAVAFPGGRHGDVTIHYAVEPTPLDTAGAIAFAARQVGVADTFVVLNGDVVCDVDVRRLVAAHRRFGTAATIHLTPVDDPSAFGVVEVGTDGLVQRFVEKPRAGETDSNLINAGTYVFEPAVLDSICDPADPLRKISVERETFPRLVAQRQLAAVATDDYWLDTGRPHLYRQANLDLAFGARRGCIDAAVHVTSTTTGAELDRAVVGPGALVESDARVVRSVLLPGARVGRAATVVDSIVAGSVGAHAVVADSVIGAGYRVPERAMITDEALPRPV